jgi:hypothetical protein
MVKMNLEDIRFTDDMHNKFSSTFQEFLSSHLSFQSLEKEYVKILTAIESSLILAAQDTLRESSETENTDTEIEIMTIFEILNGEKLSEDSVIEFNLRVMEYILKNMSNYNSEIINRMRKNATEYCNKYKYSLN